MKNWPKRTREMIYNGTDGYLHIRAEHVWNDGRVTITDSCLYLIPGSKEANEYVSARSRK